MLDMHIRPSELMDISDAYTAFCFDEACAYILKELKDGKEPIFKKGSSNDLENSSYKSPSDLYKKYN